MDGVNANVAAGLAERAGAHPERTAIVEGGRGRRRRLTFGELAARVAELAAGLEARGIRAGDSVLLFVPMSIDLYVALLAILHLGGVAVFVDAWAGRARLDAAIDVARPRALLASPRAHLLRLVSPALRRVPIALVCHSRLAPLDRLARRGAPQPAATLEPGAPALVTFTTGSTGRPKAAVRSHGFLWAQHRALARHLALREDDVDFPTLPVFVLNNLATGTATVLPDFDPRRPAAIDAARVHAQMVAEGVTTTSGSPAFYQRLVEWCEARRCAIPVRALYTGGAPVTPPLVRRLVEATAGSVHVVYGSTEAEPVAGIEGRAMLEAMAGEDPPPGLCVGPQVADIAVRLIRPFDGPIALGPAGWSEWEVGPGEVGEVVVHGDHVLPGYLHDLDAERNAKIGDGSQVWHRTGDGARLDPQGRLWLMGRVSQRVLRAGVTWWGSAAEVRALRVAGIRHAAYLGQPDPRLGQRAVLCVEVEGGRLDEATRQALRTALRDTPVDQVVALPLIPRDPRHASKTDMVALARRLGQGPRA